MTIEATPVRGARVSVLRRMLARPGVVLSMATLLVLLLASILAPVIAPYGLEDIDPLNSYKPPTPAHWLGTDELGRDVFSRLIFGGQIAFTIIALATLVSVVVGLIWGSAAAMGPRWLDDLLMRVGDVTLAIPSILLALIVVAAFGPSRWTLIVALGLIYAPSVARVIRAAIAVENGKEYRLAAQAVGLRPVRILVSELLPNVMPVVLAQASLTAAMVLLSEAALSFVGLGIQPPEASWGTLLQAGYAISSRSALYVVAPALVIGLTVLSLNTIGDNLQQVMDPKAEA